MSKRIRLQHPAVLKLIYFDFYGQESFCQVGAKGLWAKVYTEYFGESLKEFNRVHHAKEGEQCICLGFLSGVMYLQQSYGFFEVSKEAVFVGVEGSGHDLGVKVWINSARE